MNILRIFGLLLTCSLITACSPHNKQEIITDDRGRQFVCIKPEHKVSEYVVNFAIYQEVGKVGGTNYEYRMVWPAVTNTDGTIVKPSFSRLPK